MQISSAACWTALHFPFELSSAIWLDHTFPSLPFVALPLCHPQALHSWAMASVAGIDVILREANHDFSQTGLEFGPSTQVLPKGWTKAPGRRALHQDLIFEKDFAIKLRDGSTVWSDIFCPPSSKDEPTPAIIAWSPYGKQGNGGSSAVLFFFLTMQFADDTCPGFQSLDRVPWRAGIPRDWTSDLEKFEAPDPAEWCPRGYAIVNIDPRGVGESDGDLVMLSTQVSLSRFPALPAKLILPRREGRSRWTRRNRVHCRPKLV